MKCEEESCREMSHTGVEDCVWGGCQRAIKSRSKTRSTAKSNSRSFLLLVMKIHLPFLTDYHSDQHSTWNRFHRHQSSQTLLFHFYPRISIQVIQSRSSKFSMERFPVVPRSIAGWKIECSSSRKRKAEIDEVVEVVLL